MNTRESVLRLVGCLVTLAMAVSRVSHAADEQIHSFDVDPNWEKFGITTTGDHTKQAVQDFGWRPTNKGGGAAPGEIGGIITRAFERYVYWKKIPTTNLTDKLTISGSLANTQTAET